MEDQLKTYINPSHVYVFICIQISFIIINLKQVIVLKFLENGMISETRRIRNIYRV